MNKGIISVLSAFAGVAVGAVAVGKVTGESIDKAQNQSSKHLALFLMMNQWVKVKQEGKNLSEYFVKKGYKKIAIYGMNYAGETLLNEFINSDIEVKYGIDKNAEGICSEVEILSPDNELPNVDVVVVTAITFYDEIAEMLVNKLDCPIISLEDVLYEI